jgi:hypothetical protein
LKIKNQKSDPRVVFWKNKNELLQSIKDLPPSPLIVKFVILRFEPFLKEIKGLVIDSISFSVDVLIKTKWTFFCFEKIISNKSLFYQKK